MSQSWMEEQPLPALLLLISSASEVALEGFDLEEVMASSRFDLEEVMASSRFVAASSDRQRKSRLPPIAGRSHIFF
ncbi:hypothetical protein LWI28_026253 [Acer negundo]|uniref:Uncharacterized protein n=1 Tax=Acer negundo TaxID=4023 RepID=A0AAD5I8E8_ACENE|nr:hypothetical protein LWI28_026253 [Acer negundo]